MKGFLRNNAVVVLPYLALLLTSIGFMAVYDRVSIHLYVNSFVGDRVLDTFFYYLTYLGDGRFAAPILLLFLAYNTRLGITATLAFLIASLFSIVLKYGFFDDANRPFFTFSYIDRHTLNLVEGVDVYIHNSFPSGHATQAFAILMCAAFATRRGGLKVLYLALALLTCFSRMYLSQHWIADVTAGSFIGMLSATLLYYFIVQRNSWPRLNRPLPVLVSRR